MLWCSRICHFLKKSSIIKIFNIFLYLYSWQLWNFTISIIIKLFQKIYSLLIVATIYLSTFLRSFYRWIYHSCYSRYAWWSVFLWNYISALIFNDWAELIDIIRCINSRKWRRIFSIWFELHKNLSHLTRLTWPRLFKLFLKCHFISISRWRKLCWLCNSCHSSFKLSLIHFYIKFIIYSII